MIRARARVSMLAAVALALGVALPVRPPAARAAGGTPTVVSVFPRQGLTAGGTAVTITGTNFVAPLVVTFDGVNATTVVVKNETTLTCLTPGHLSGDADVVVTEVPDPGTLHSDPFSSFHYNSNLPCYVWIPRALGSGPGDVDLCIVDLKNGRVAGAVDLNASLDALQALVPAPLRAQLPDDDHWAVTQILFDPNGAFALLATAGVPGASDSGAVLVLSTAVAVGDQAGNPLVGLLPGGVDATGLPQLVGNPYQVAFSSDHLTLYAADGGSWKTPATASPEGAVLSWDLKNLASAVTGATTDLKPPKPLRSNAVGVLPLLSYDLDSSLGWGTNSSFKGVILDRQGFTAVTSVRSQKVTRVRLSNLGVGSDGPRSRPFNSASVAIEGADAAPAQVTTAIPSPFDGDAMFVETSGSKGGLPVTDHFVYRLSSGLASVRVRSAVPGEGKVWKPVVKETPAARFQEGVATADMGRFLERAAWPHPGVEAVVAIPGDAGSVTTFDPATGVSTPPSDPTGFPPPPVPSASLAYDDASGFFYARHADGSGWTVYQASAASTLPSGTCPGGAVTVDPGDSGLQPVLAVADGSGADSLRVVGDGSSLVGTTSSSTLVVIEGRKTQPQVHTVVGSPIDLPLDAAGGPVFPEPGANCGAARSFPLSSGTGSLVRITGPPGYGSSNDPFPSTSVSEPPPEFTGSFPEGSGATYFLELGTQFDFLPVPGSIRMRVRYDPANGGQFVPTPVQWRRLLRGAASIGTAERFFYARLVAAGPPGFRITSPTVCYRVEAGSPPGALSVVMPSGAPSRDAPPTLGFTVGDPADTGRYFVDVSTAAGSEAGSFPPAKGYPAILVAPDYVEPDYSATVPAGAWRRAFDAAVRKSGPGNLAVVQFTVLHRDPLGRVLGSDPVLLTFTAPTQ